MVGRIDHGEWVGGEGLFVPSKPDGVGDEDDGFLVTFVSPKDGGNSGTVLQEANIHARSISCWSRALNAKSREAAGDRLANLALYSS